MILIQPSDRKKRKTDRRDAASLSELLWVNRDRLLAGKPVRGLRQVDVASPRDQENRRLTTLRKEAGQTRTRLINKVRHVLRRHNLQCEMPTKTFPTLSAIPWLKKVVLSPIDRLEMDDLLVDLEQIEARVKRLDKAIVERSRISPDAVLLSSMPGVGSFTATGLSCRVGRVERFPRSHSLANYWGLSRTSSPFGGGVQVGRRRTNSTPPQCGKRSRAPELLDMKAATYAPMKRLPACKYRSLPSRPLANIQTG